MWYPYWPRTKIWKLHATNKPGLSCHITINVRDQTISGQITIELLSFDDLTLKRIFFWSNRKHMAIHIFIANLKLVSVKKWCCLIKCTWKGIRLRSLLFIARVDDTSLFNECNKKKYDIVHLPYQGSGCWWCAFSTTPILINCCEWDFNCYQMQRVDYIFFINWTSLLFSIWSGPPGGMTNVSYHLELCRTFIRYCHRQTLGFNLNCNSLLFSVLT